MSTYQFVRPTQSLATLATDSEQHFDTRLIRVLGAVEKSTNILLFPRLARLKNSWWKTSGVVIELIDLSTLGLDDTSPYSSVLWDYAKQKASPMVQNGHIEYTLNYKVSLKDLNKFVQEFILALETNSVDESIKGKLAYLYQLTPIRQSIVENTYILNARILI